MATDIWSIPRDPSSGAVVGSYFLLHETADLNATLGMVRFEQGRSTKTLAGRQLLSYVGAMGRYLTLEPADDAARAALGLPSEAAPVVAETAPVAAPEVVPEPALADPVVTTPTADAPEGDGLDAIDDVDALRSIAAGLYVDVDTRWKAGRLRSEIRKARGV